MSHVTKRPDRIYVWCLMTHGQEPTALVVQVCGSIADPTCMEWLANLCHKNISEHTMSIRLGPLHLSMGMRTTLKPDKPFYYNQSNRDIKPLTCAHTKTWCCTTPPRMEKGQHILYKRSVNSDLLSSVWSWMELQVDWSYSHVIHWGWIAAIGKNVDFRSDVSQIFSGIVHVQTHVYSGLYWDCLCVRRFVWWKIQHDSCSTLYCVGIQCSCTHDNNMYTRKRLVRC